MKKIVYSKNGVEIMVKSKNEAKVRTYGTIIQNLFNRREMLKVYDWEKEDYRRAMISSPVENGEDTKPLIDTDPDAWVELFDATRERVKEPDYTLVNIITVVLGVALILFYHFG